VNLEELRIWLTKQLRTSIPDGIWDALIEGRYAKPDLDEMELEDLVFEAQRLMRVWWEAKADGGGRKPPGRKTTIDLRREIAVDFGGNEALRARAFSELAADLGEIRPDVEGFRDDFLEGKVLTDDQADEFLTQHGGLDGDGLSIKELHWLGERLAKDYRWRQGDAMWFVLTGRVPPVFPMSAEGLLHWSVYGPHTATITLTIEAWVDAKEVDKVYRDLQRQILGNRDNRPIGERRLRLLEFVEEQKRTNGDGWRAWMQRWNEACTQWGRPEWKYEEQEHPSHAVRYFRRSHKETYERLMYPEYHPPNWRPYAPTPWQAWRNKEYERMRHGILKQRRPPPEG
jgi:hypothetical protein